MSRRQAIALARLHWKKLAAIAASLTVIFGAIVSAHEAAMVVEPYVPVTQQQFRDSIDGVIDRALAGATMAIDRAVMPLTMALSDNRLAVARMSVNIDRLNLAGLKAQRPPLIVLVTSNPDSTYLAQQLGALDDSIREATEMLAAHSCAFNKLVQPGFICTPSAGFSP